MKCDMQRSGRRAFQAEEVQVQRPRRGMTPGTVQDRYESHSDWNGSEQGESGGRNLGLEAKGPHPQRQCRPLVF